MTPDIAFHDVSNNIRFADDKLVFERTQEIPSSFLDDLAERRAATASDFAPMGNYHMAASIPVSVVEEWMAEGFNIFDRNNTLEDIMKRLRRYDMERLIATSKRLT